MKHKNYILFFLTIILLFQSSCRKYEEGGLINSRVENKIRGYKKITKYSVDGVDSLSMINSIFNNNDYYFSFLTNDLGNVINTYSNDELIQKHCPSGFWELSDNKEFISMQLRSPTDSACNNSTVMPFSATKWKIMRLKKKDMWLEATVGGKLYGVYFVSI